MSMHRDPIIEGVLASLTDKAQEWDKLEATAPSARAAAYRTGVATGLRLAYTALYLALPSLSNENEDTFVASRTSRDEHDDPEDERALRKSDNLGKELSS